MTKMVDDQSDTQLVTRSLLRSRAIGLFWLVTIIVLVLSKAVLVIVIEIEKTSTQYPATSHFPLLTFHFPLSQRAAAQRISMQSP